MPAPGVPNNPGGTNGLYETEAPYGAIKRLQQLTSESPIPGAPGMNAPKRATRRSQRGTQPEPPPVTPEQTMTAPGQAVPYPVALATTWAAVAATPGASPLVQAIAQEAQRGV